MRFCPLWHIGDHPRHSLHIRDREVRLPKPERSERHHEYTHPFQPVPCPTRNHTAERYVGGSSGEPERLTSRTLANFPDKSVVIKMQERGSGDHTRQDAFNRVDSEMRINEGERAIGENEANVKANQRSAPSEDEPHEPANIAVFLDAVAVVNPNERQVLHVVE